MDNDTYDQHHVPAVTVGDAANFMLENTEATIALHDGIALYVELPALAELVISYTEPGMQGDRSTGGTTPATLVTGAQIQLPPCIPTAEKVKANTRTPDYLRRINS